MKAATRAKSPEAIEAAKQEDIRDCARDLLLAQRAKDWLLEKAE